MLAKHYKNPIHSILRIGILLLTIYLLSTVNGLHGQENSSQVDINSSQSHSLDKVSSWSWDSSIQSGDNYEWNVTTFQYLGKSVHQYSEGDFSVIEGSLIEILVVEEVSNLNYLDILNQSQLVMPFILIVDGKIVENVGTLSVEFIYPSVVVWNNGSADNLFEFTSPRYATPQSTTPIAYIDGEDYVIDYWTRDVHKVIRRDIETGILKYWELQFSQGKIIYELVEKSDEIRENSPVPGINEEEIISEELIEQPSNDGLEIKSIGTYLLGLIIVPLFLIFRSYTFSKKEEITLVAV